MAKTIYKTLKELDNAREQYRQIIRGFFAAGNEPEAYRYWQAQENFIGVATAAAIYFQEYQRSQNHG